MTFIVTYRDNSGSLVDDVIESPDRTRCLAVCRTRGITPVRIKEGGANAARNSGVSRRPSSQRAVFALLVIFILIAAGGTWWWLCRDGATSRSSKTTSSSTQVIEAKTKSDRPYDAEYPVQRSAAPVTTNVHERQVTVETQPLEPPASSNRVTRPRFFKPTMTLEDGSVVDLRPPPAIKDPMERALAAVATPGGMAIPFSAALRRFSKEQIMEMLARDVEFSKDESDVVVEKKVAVQQVKDMFKAYLKDGHTLDDAIREIDRQMKMESMHQAAAYKGLAMAVKTGDGELVNRYVEEQNKSLQKQGLRLLTVPPQFKVAVDPTATEKISKEQ